MRQYTLKENSNTGMKIGKLKFKNDEKTKPINKKKKEEPEIEEIFQQQLKAKDKLIQFEPRIGSGLVVTSAKAMNGEGTKFLSEVDQGDIISLKLPLEAVSEERIVMLVLGDNSLLLEDAFTQDITTFTEYTIKKRDKVEKGVDLTEQYQKKLQELNKTKPIQKPVMNVRVKKGVWSYETKKVELQQGASKEELLNIRSKMGKDKFCW